MSYSLDVNILLHASNRGSDLHGWALQFLQECALRDELMCLAWPTLMGYLRVATHGRVFERPLSFAEARGNVNALLSRPQVRAVGEQEGFWALYTRLCEPVAPRGKLVPDAHLYALLVQHDVDTLYTTDRDMRKFDGLSVVNPFE